GARSVPPAWVHRAADRAARPPNRRAPAWSDRRRARGPAAAPPTSRRADLLIRIRGSGDRGSSVTADRRQEKPSARRSGCRHRPGATLAGRRVHRPPTKPETVTRSLFRHLPYGTMHSVGSPPDCHHGHGRQNPFAHYSTVACRAPIALEVPALLQ